MSAQTTYRGRLAAQIENSALRVTVLVDGGHIAEVFDKRSGVNPLWTPHWESVEPSAFDPARHRGYGDGVDAGLLAGITGHNLCLDIFGAPSDEEAAAGLPVHGEASNIRYNADATSAEIILRAHLPRAQLTVERRLELHPHGLRIRESVVNESGTDKPIGWTQHVTLGAPFLQKGRTQFRASATRSRTIESTFGAHDYLRPAEDFLWPMAPGIDGGTADLRVYSDAEASSAYTAHLMDPGRDIAFFSAFSPDAQLAFGYVWRRADFPWLGIWEENASRTQPPWRGRTLTRGMEFGVSPFPESRRRMVERGRLFDTPTFRWIPAGSRLGVEYWCICRGAAAVPETLDWPAS